MRFLVLSELPLIKKRGQLLSNSANGLQELKTFKHAAGRCMEEYFVTSNAEEVAGIRWVRGQHDMVVELGILCAVQVSTVLQELGMSTYHHEFVKKVWLLRSAKIVEMI